MYQISLLSSSIVLHIFVLQMLIFFFQSFSSIRTSKSSTTWRSTLTSWPTLSASWTPNLSPPRTKSWSYWACAKAPRVVRSSPHQDMATSMLTVREHDKKKISKNLWNIMKFGINRKECRNLWNNYFFTKRTILYCKNYFNVGYGSLKSMKLCLWYVSLHVYSGLSGT